MELGQKHMELDQKGRIEALNLMEKVEPDQESMALDKEYTIT